MLVSSKKQPPEFIAFIAKGSYLATVGNAGLIRHKNVFKTVHIVDLTTCPILM